MSEPSKSPSEGRRNEAILGPFTFRDLTLFGGVLTTFVGSLLPLLRPDWPLNVWNAQNLFFLIIGMLAPVAAAVLFAWRRVSPEAKLRVGSLSVDQFASVTAVMSALFYFVFTVTSLSPGGLVGLLGGLVIVAATTLARVVPQFAGDFDGRAEVPAHVTARDAVPPVRRPERVEGSSGNGRENAGGNAGASAGEKAGPLAGAMAGFADMKSRLAGGKGGASRTGSEGREEEAGFPGTTAAAAAVGAGAVGAGALGSAAWAGHTDDAAWGGHQDPAGTSSGGAGEAAGSTESAGQIDASQPKEIGAADLLTPTANESFAAEDGQLAARRSGDGEDAAGTGSRRADSFGAVGAVSAGDAAALEATEAHLAAREGGGRPSSDAPTALRSMRPADDNEGRDHAEGGTAAMSTIGDADGEVYGAPEPFADNPAEPKGKSRSENTVGPATAVFPASSGRDAQPQAPTDQGDIGATRPYDEQGQPEAFWFAVSQPRSAVDPSTGRPVFSLDPGQWILALQDRGHEFLVQSPDGRIGILRELSGIERG